VHQCVIRQFPDINITTVYRTLETPESLGLVGHTHVHDGVAHYHLADEPVHQHLVCVECGADKETDISALDPVVAELERLYDFQPVLGHIAILGRCHDCRH
jgi:Fur family ferric uptake transcriptional regulator